MLKQIMATVDRYEGEFAILRHKDHEILWAKDDLPENVKEGDIIALTAMTQEQATKSRTDLAKELLNNILNAGLRSPETAPKPGTETEEQRLERIDKKLDDIDRKLGG